MSLLSSGLFWGIVIVFLGFSIILREIFDVHFPFLRVLFGAVLIWWGVRMIAGGFQKNETVAFSETDSGWDDGKKEYSVVFGRGNFDLFKAPPITSDRKLEVNVVFGNGKLILNDSIPTIVKTNTVFGTTRTPNGTTAAFGETAFRTSTYKEGEPALKIETNTVFGQLEIETKRW